MYEEVTGLVEWYNHEHRHSAIRFLTPAQRYEGLDENFLDTIKPSTNLLAPNIHNTGAEVPVIGKKSKQFTLIQTRPKQKRWYQGGMIIQNTNQSVI